MTTAKQVMDAAGVSTSSLSIRQHQRNYAWVGVRVESGAIVEAEYRDDMINDTETYISAAWHIVGRYGTGSTTCNCDACCRGDDPETWAGSADWIESIEEEMQRAIDALIE